VKKSDHHMLVMCIKPLTPNNSGDMYLNTKQKQVILVIGMHRSGTSLLAGILRILGVSLGEEKRLMHAQQNVNAKGFWEHKEIGAIHEELLAILGSYWSSIAPLPEEWWNDKRILPYRQRLLNIVRDEFLGNSLWGMKDPRVCRLLPLWRSIFEEIGYSPKCIIISRHPYEVASSLAKRDGLSPTYSLVLWLIHVLELEEYSRGFKRSWVTYEALNTDWEHTVLKVSGDIEVTWPCPVNSTEVKCAMAAFVSKGLWHNHSTQLIGTYSDEFCYVLELYDILLDLTKISENADILLKRIDAIRTKTSPLITLLTEVHGQSKCDRDRLAVATQVVGERDAYIKCLEKTVKSRDHEIAAAKQVVGERDVYIKHLEDTLKSHD